MYYIIISLEGDSFSLTYYCAGTNCTTGCLVPFESCPSLLLPVESTCSIFSEIVVFSPSPVFDRYHM